MDKNNRTSGKDPLFWNKIFGGVLGTLLVWRVILEIGGLIYVPQEQAEAAYLSDLPQIGPVVASEVINDDLPTLLVSADVAKGERVARKCKSCHGFEQGGRNGIGPNLWDVIGRDRARIDGFNYSSAMRAFGGSWDFQSLSDYLENPKKFIQGTNMAFVGIKKPDDRANLLAYMRTFSDSPVDVPVASPVP